VRPIGGSNSANSLNSNILPYSYSFKKWEFAQFCKFCDILCILFLYRLKSTLKVAIHFTPLQGVSDKIRSAEGTDPMIFYVSGASGTSGRSNTDW